MKKYIQMIAKIMYMAIMAILLLSVSVSSDSLAAQCIDPLDNITFSFSGGNNSNQNETEFLLTQDDIIIDISDTNVFSPQQVGNYQIVAINFPSTQRPIYAIGQDIDMITGTCFELSVPLVINVCEPTDWCAIVDCSIACTDFIGDITLNAVKLSGAEYIDLFLLADRDGRILEISNNPSFFISDPDLYLVFPISYLLTDVPNNLVVGAFVEEIIGDCVDIGLPIVINVCIETDAKLQLSKTAEVIDNDNDGIITINDSVLYTFTICNVGNIAISDIQIDDSRLNVFGLLPLDPDLDVDECSSAQFLYPLSQDDLSQGSILNQASAQGLDQNGMVISDLSNDPTIFGSIMDIDGQLSLPTLTDFEQEASITGNIWKDENLNGTYEISEDLLEGITVILRDCNGNPISQTITNAAGQYIFDNLPAGQYSVLVLPNDNCGFTASNTTPGPSIVSHVDTQGSSDCLELFGPNVEVVNVGLIYQGSIGDFVWFDINGNGVQDFTEPGIADIQVNLFDYLGNFIVSTTTDNAGNYLFDNVPPGDYFLEFTQLGDFTVTTFASGVNEGLDSDVNATFGPGTTPLFTLSPNEIDLSFDLGLYTLIPVGETVWYDSDLDNIKDFNENGINGLYIQIWQLVDGAFTLYDVQATSHKPNTPSDDGYFKFLVPPGTYQIRADIPPTGLVPVIKDFLGATPLTDDNEPTIDSDLGFSQVSDNFTIKSGDELCNIGIGYYPEALVGNRVWNDANLNGRQDFGEQGVLGIKISAYNNQDQMVRTTMTDQNGKYAIDGLGGQEYYLKFEDPSNTFSYTAADATSDKLDSDVNHSNGFGTTSYIALTSGQKLGNIDAGLIKFGVVPLEWLDFSVLAADRSNQLSWKTAAEYNVSHFEIERAIDDLDYFQSIGEQIAHGTIDINTYHFEDMDIFLPGTYYYRIKQVDLDGSYSYSEVRLINREETIATIGGNLDWSIYPNPTSDIITLTWTKELTSDAVVSVVSVDGRYMIDRQLITASLQGSRDFSLDVSQWASGTYLLSILNNDIKINRKIIVID